MSSDDKPEKLLAPAVAPQPSPIAPRPVIGNPKGSPMVITGNPKGSIGFVRNPIARLGVVLALLAAIGLAVWRWVL